MAGRKFGANTEEARSAYAALLVTMWKFIREDVMNVTVCKKSGCTVPPIGLGVAKGCQTGDVGAWASITIAITP